MQKNKIILILTLGMILSPVIALQAEEVNPDTTVNTTTGITKIREEFRKEIGNIKDNSKQKAEEIRREAKEVKNTIIDSTKIKRDDLKQDTSDKIKAIMSSTTLTAEQKATEVKKIRDERVTEMKAIVETTQAEIKANVEKKIEALKSNIETRKAEIAKKITAKKDEIKKKLETKAQEKVKETLAKIYDRLNDNIEKLTGVDVKVLEKIEKASTNGVDVTAAKAQYAIARTALDKAITDINATKAVSIDQTSTQTSKETLRALVKTAEESIKIAGAEYRKIIPLIIPSINTTNTNTNNQ